MKAQIESRFDYSETQSRPVTPRQSRAAKAKSISQSAKNANSTVSELNNILSAGPSKKGALSLTELIGDTGNLQVRFENGAYKLYKFDGDAFPINPNTGFEDKSKGKGIWKLQQNLGTKVNDYKGIFGFDTPGLREYWSEAVKNL